MGAHWARPPLDPPNECAQNQDQEWISWATPQWEPPPPVTSSGTSVGSFAGPVSGFQRWPRWLVSQIVKSCFRLDTNYIIPHSADFTATVALCKVSKGLDNVCELPIQDNYHLRILQFYSNSTKKDDCNAIQYFWRPCTTYNLVFCGVTVSEWCVLSTPTLERKADHPQRVHLWYLKE